MGVLTCRKYYLSIEKKLSKELRAVKFPGKKMQILGSHLNSKALKERETQMLSFVDGCMSKEEVMRLPETHDFLIQNPVNVKYEV